MNPISSTVRNRPPCKGCTRRAPACHDRCKDYADWRTEVDRIRAAKKKYYDNLPSKF